MEFYGIKYIQGKQSFITTVLPMKFIMDNYEVLIYGENADNGADPVYGYQRAPKPMHYNKIAKELLKDINSQVTTNAIVLGINIDDLEKEFDADVVKRNKSNELIKFTTREEKLNHKFRVIDGQHRIKGFEKAYGEYNEDGKLDYIAEYQVSVIIMLLEPNYRRPEVTAFTNINSKAKPLKMDLTKLAEYKYDLKEKPSEVNIYNYLIISVIKKINSGEACKYWENGIIFDVNSQNGVGIVGLKAFYDSIESICKNEIKNELSEIENSEFDQKKRVLDLKAEELAEVIGNCWNIVFEKWNIYTSNEIYDSGEILKTYYDDSYYIQKTMGVSAINTLISDCYKNGIDEFEKIIKQSKLVSEDWKKSGKFAGLSSAGGAKKIRNYIKNEEI